MAAKGKGKPVHWCPTCHKPKYYTVRQHLASGEYVMICAGGHAIGKLTAKMQVQQKTSKQVRREVQAENFKREHNKL